MTTTTTTTTTNETSLTGTQTDLCIRWLGLDWESAGYTDSEALAIANKCQAKQDAGDERDYAEILAEVVAPAVSYYIVANVNGPISAKLEAETEEEAKAELKAMSAERLRAIIDDASTDLEDELGFSGEGMSDSEFAAKLEKKGATCVAPSQIVGEWEIWCVTE